MAARVWIVASISRIHWKVCSSRLLRVYERLIESGLSSFASACMPGRAGRQTHACSAYHQRQSFSALAASSRASHQLMQLPRRVGARTSQDHNRGSGARQLHRSCGSAGVEPGAPRGGGCRCVRRLCAPCPAGACCCRCLLFVDFRCRSRRPRVERENNANTNIQNGNGNQLVLVKKHRKLPTVIFGARIMAPSAALRSRYSSVCSAAAGAVGGPWGLQGSEA